MVCARDLRIEDSTPGTENIPCSSVPIHCYTALMLITPTNFEPKETHLTIKKKRYSCQPKAAMYSRSGTQSCEKD